MNNLFGFAVYLNVLLLFNWYVCCYYWNDCSLTACFSDIVSVITADGRVIVVSHNSCSRLSARTVVTITLQWLFLFASSNVCDRLCSWQMCMLCFTYCHFATASSLHLTVFDWLRWELLSTVLSNYSVVASWFFGWWALIIWKKLIKLLN